MTPRERVAALPPGGGDDKLTVLIKAFERPCCVARAVASVRERFPALPVLVCDDSRAPLFGDGEEPTPGVRWFTLPFEAGHTLGAGRNALVDRASTPFVFLMDDDQFVTGGTRLPEMLAFLERSGFDLVGGAQGRWDYGAAVFEREGDLILQRFHRHHGVVDDRVVACDRVSNTFVARTAALRRVRWEERVYAHEHADFFLRARAAGLGVAQMGGTHVGHDWGCERGLVGRALGAVSLHPDAAYRLLRFGGSREAADAGYRRHVLDAHGVRDIVDRHSLRDRLALYRRIGLP